jgi:predicted dehydrogenase
MLHVKNDTPDKTGNAQPHFYTSQPTLAVHSTETGSSEVPMYYSFPSRHADGYSRELNHFLDVVQAGAVMSVTGAMTAAVSKIADACEESAKSGQPVQLAWGAAEVPGGYQAA